MRFWAVRWRSGWVDIFHSPDVVSDAQRIRLVPREPATFGLEQPVTFFRQASIAQEWTFDWPWYVQ